MWYERLTQMLPIAHRPVRVQGIGEDTPSNMLSFINFEPLELYWTYFLALQTTTPKIPPMRLMSQKMRWCAMSLNHGLWHLFMWIWALLGFRRDFPKIHDNVDVVQVVNVMKPCGVKNLSSTPIIKWFLKEASFSFQLCFSISQKLRNIFMLST